ncbi:MAG: dienelactone hydrolase family protein [Alphaproteobacteria bacterium]|jgi:carboxymethylenebutenolidase|nr:dienelactone hydrolase family protein [Alphaproteobacteria bacterium]
MTKSISMVQLSKDFPDFKGLLGVPDQENAPGLLIIQEIFGINHVMHELVEHYTSLGYLTLCPDLFWRFQPGIVLDDRIAEDWKEASHYYQHFSVDQGIEDLKIGLNYLKNHDSCSGKVGSVGFCLGGRLAFLMSTRSDVDCSVSYYGVALDQNLNEASQIKNPLLCHLAELDQFVPAVVQTQILKCFAGSRLVTCLQYKGMDHAFARKGGSHYNQQEAERANQITQTFLQTHLR